jgi:hypothetical protein
MLRGRRETKEIPPGNSRTLRSEDLKLCFDSRLAATS